MIHLTDIHSLTDFQRNAKNYAQQIKDTKNPLVLTIHGKAELVVQDAETFEALIERLERAEAAAAIREAIEEFDRGEGKPARQAIEELRKKHGI